MFPGIITIFTFQDKGGQRTTASKATANNAAAAAAARARAEAGINLVNNRVQVIMDDLLGWSSRC